WVAFQAAPETSTAFDACELALRWEDGQGELATSRDARIQGQGAFGRPGVVVGQMRALPVSLYTGVFFSMNGATVVPRESVHLPAIWTY
ncbi:hypothetical protein OFM04_32720, partial [Escherichia coli]|nr:hypothetical protein [Escherichia coli]